MTLTQGARLGAYEIVAAIGAGGMGEVFRARDTKLNRDVAIKVLPTAFADDPERLARFTREAQTLASLNHPNIATIYGFEEVASSRSPAGLLAMTEGASPDGRATTAGMGASRALVMELIEGEDLSAQMARGPVPIAEALPIARQIAEALEAAHEQGIVHRDLKPGNIKVRTDGTVKVLDFGLAKAMDATSPSRPNVSHSPTLTHQGTMAGLIIGTAAYMSPEQAKGKPVDKRADIWAFGVVLYEMLTGRRAFKGEDVSETLASVLKDALSMDALPAATPPRLKRLLERCLDRDLKNRLRDIGEARFEISKIESGAPDAFAVDGAATRPTQGRRLAWPAFAIASLMALALAVPAVRHLREDAPVATPEMRVDIDPPDAPRVWDFALSPDGLSIAFAVTGDPGRIWIRRLNQTAAQPVAGTENARGVFWSPDSKSIGFWSEGTLKRLDLADGALTALCEGGVGATWGQDGVILFRTSSGSGLQRVAASGGQPSAVFPKRTDYQRSPAFHPDGRRFLYVAGATGSKGTILLASLDGGEPRSLFAGTAALWLSADWIVYLDQDKLLARRMNLATNEPVGEPELIANIQNVVTISGGGSLGLFSTSLDGKLAYRNNGIPTIEMSWRNRRGQPAGPRTELKGFVNAQEISPDGTRVAVDMNADGNRDVWLRDEKLGSPTRLTFDPEVDGFPVWSPDGRSIAFESNRKGNYDIYLKPASGSMAEQPLLEAPGQQWPVDFSRDGGFLLYYDQINSGDLMALPLNGDERRPISVAATPATENLGAISPDSRWVAYQTSESGRSEVVVQAFPRAAGKWQISTEGGSSPRWSADGRELFFVSGGMLMASAVNGARDSFVATPAVKLFPMSASGVPLRQRYAVARDGRFLTIVESDAATTPVTLVLNWKPGAK